MTEESPPYGAGPFVEDYLDCWQAVPAAESFVDEHLYQQCLDGSSIRADLSDLVAQGYQQSLRVWSPLRISALTG